jgi:hypothetical protein
MRPSQELTAEMLKLHKEGKSIYRICKILNMHIYQVCQIVDPERFYRVYYKYGKTDKTYKKTELTKARFQNDVVKTTVKQNAKNDCLEWIKSYYQLCEDAEYPMKKMYADYEYHFLNPVFKPVLSKSIFVKCMIEAGFKRVFKTTKIGEKYTCDGFFNCEKRW